MSAVFDKSVDLFPVKSDHVFLSHCGISPLYGPAAHQAIHLITEQQLRGGGGLIEVYEKWMNALREQSALLLRTQAENMAFVRNTSEAMSMLANGYPFEPGDEVITFVQEYPANYHPWVLQERRGVKVRFLSNVPARDDIPSAIIGTWSEQELLSLINPKTRVIALSHVQFTSGYAADLQRLGEICREHQIDLVIDAAQSLGCMPVYPEACNVAAVASAGWKWLLGPVGAAVFYTRPDFRDKIAITQVGVETMLQTYNFLDLSWAPNPTARRFEYSTSPIQLVAGLATCL
jgi:selenocysteine lyase/cysteine desulfurase